ncbi:MAG: hypothetical protein JXB07_16765 [Anaerolineae bacterium]|nr:hypothetical protein [Anaerolineae bacterium]
MADDPWVPPEKQTQDEAKIELRRKNKQIERVAILIVIVGIAVMGAGMMREDLGPAAIIAGFAMMGIGALAYFLSPLLLGLLSSRSAAEGGANLDSLRQAWSTLPATMQIRLIGLGLGILVIVLALINLWLELEWLNTTAVIMTFAAGVLFMFPFVVAAFMPKSRRVVLPLKQEQTLPGGNPSTQLVVDRSVPAARKRLVRGIASIFITLFAAYGIAMKVPLLIGLALILLVAIWIEKLQVIVTRLSAKQKSSDQERTGSRWSISHTLLLVLFIGSLIILSVGASIQSVFLTIGGIILFITTPLIVLATWLIGKIRAHSVIDDSK